MRIEAKNLEQALMKAARELECSVVDIEYEVVQYHKGGFLGLFQKNAIIEARSKRRNKYDKKYQKKPYDKPRYNDNYGRRDYGAREFGANEQKPYESKNFERKNYENKGYESKPYERKDYDRGYEKSYERRDYDNKGFERKEFDNKFDSKGFDSKEKFADKPFESKFESKYALNSSFSTPNLDTKGDEVNSFGSYAPKISAQNSYTPRPSNFNAPNSYESNDSRPLNANSANLAQRENLANVSEKKSAPQSIKSAENAKSADTEKSANAENATTQSAPNLAPLGKSKYVVRDDAIFNSFHKESGVNPKIYIDEIRIQLEKLLKAGDFEIRIMELSVYDKNSIYIRLDGNDAALLIGKEAYRYKALSYLLHNWINAKYNLLIRLEIADFLRNQAQGMDFYLKTIIEKVESTGRAQTKPLDGVLVKIALEKLRERFPNKYVGIRQNGEQRFVIINDFLKKDE